MLSSFCICGTAAMTAAALRTCAKNQFYIFGEWCNSEHASAEQVRFLHRQYSLDEKR